MHTVHAKKDDKNVVRGKVGKPKTGLILTARGGRHDNRPKRLRTRKAINSRAMADW